MTCPNLFAYFLLADMMAEDSVDQTAEFPMSQSFMNLSLEEQEAKREEWRRELSEVCLGMRVLIVLVYFPAARNLRQIAINSDRKLHSAISLSVMSVS